MCVCVCVVYRWCMTCVGTFLTWLSPSMAESTPSHRSAQQQGPTHPPLDLLHLTLPVSLCLCVCQALGHLGRPLEAFSHVCCPCNPPPWNEANSPVVQWGGYAPPVQGVMVGRTAYNSPWTFRHADSTFYNATDPGRAHTISTLGEDTRTQGPCPSAAPLICVCHVMCDVM